MRTNIVPDDDLVQQGFAPTGLRAKQALVHPALSELVRRRRRKDLLDLAGKVKLRPDFDHKAMRRARGDPDCRNQEERKTDDPTDGRGIAQWLAHLAALLGRRRR